jgi:hypothetical protein
MKITMPTKSRTEEFFLRFYEVLLREDMVRHHGSPTQFERDWKTISNRLRNEGLSFLTKTLPLLAKAIDKALVSGALTCPRNFKKLRGTGYPAFLQVLHERVFNVDGSVKADPDISAVKDLRQICYLLYKYEQPHDESVIEAFLQDFKATDSSLGSETPDIIEEDVELSNIQAVARALLSDLFRDTDFSDIVPGHGPGAVATGEKNWEKMEFCRFYDDIHQVYPYYKFFFANAMDLAANTKAYKSLKRYQSGTAKVVLVPKDSRGPRLISMEPLEYQWIQQGLSKALRAHVEIHPSTRGHVNFTDQTVNRKLALSGSISNDSVTLDMKEASDRVSLWLVRNLFADTPILKYLLGTRTTATELPNGDILPLLKFAPMGSSLCFPVEALVFWSLSVATLHVRNSISLKRAKKAVYVYGDDIIIKGENHAPLYDTFPEFKLLFNSAKCCTSGIFRESCGMDAVLGNEVNVLKLKRLLPKSPYDADKYVSYIAYVNRLYHDAYYSSSSLLEKFLTSLFGNIPQVTSQSDVPGFYSERSRDTSRHLFPRKWNSRLQCWIYKVRKNRSTRLERPMDRCEYHRKLVVRSDEFQAGIYTVPYRVKFQLG